MIPVIAIRPEPGLAATIAAARAAGLDVHGHPLFAVVPVAWDAPDPAGHDALLLGSANALRHAGPALDAWRGRTAHVVGQATAAAARDAGLAIGVIGEGGLQGVLDRLDGSPARLLRLAGREHVPLAPPAGVTIDERIVYASDPVPMPDALAARLAAPAIVLVHSAEAARHFAAECDARGIDRAAIALAAIGPRVAAAAGTGWRLVATAERPDDAALLALASELCQTLRPGMQEAGQSLMDEDVTGPAIAPPLAAASRRPARGGRMLLIVALFAFVIGVVLAGWLALRGDLDFLMPGSARTAPARIAGAPGIVAPVLPDALASQQASYAVGGVETRLALLEERMARLDLQASAASGNAARAEGLLIAFAARRVLGKGGQLGYLEDQLKLRFGGAQPDAVRSIVDFGKAPVTIDELYSGLDALGPALAEAPGSEGGWTRLRRELSSLLVVRRANSPSLNPRDRLQRARLMLTSGRTGDAIGEVSRLPGAESAAGWIENARRYDAAQQALDVIETAAMLEPRKLQDASGNTVDQPSPLAQPADMAAEAQASQAPLPPAPATQAAR